MDKHNERDASATNSSEAENPVNTATMLDSWDDWAASQATQVVPVDAPRAYRAIFFDLDGTLLPMELEEFLGTYFRLISGFIGARGFDGHEFASALKQGTAAMAMHDGTGTNKDAYWKKFFELVDANALDWPAVTDAFYETEFGKVGASVQPNPAVPRALTTLVEKGYPLLLTTMPMFPRRAVEHRLEWAGANPSHFSRLTTYENSTSVKPKLEYYAENLAACGLRGEDVLMVGNNTVEDLAIMSLGADAYLVTDHLLDTVNFDLGTVKHGTMEEFAQWVEGLPPCENPAESVEEGRISTQAHTAALSANDNSKQKDA